MILDFLRKAAQKWRIKQRHMSLPLGQSLLTPGFIEGLVGVMAWRRRVRKFPQTFDAEMFLPALGDGLADFVSHLRVAFGSIQLLPQQLVFKAQVQAPAIVALLA